MSSLKISNFAENNTILELGSGNRPLKGSSREKTPLPEHSVDFSVLFFLDVFSSNSRPYFRQFGYGI